MKKSMIGVLFVLLAAVPSLRAGSDEKDAKRLDKELKKISLTAAVMDGRRVVNRVMAEELGVSRKQLVERAQERKQTGLAYGDLFGLHEVARLARVPLSQVAHEMDEGQGVAEVSAKHQVELKAILAEAKKLNKKIDGELGHTANGDEDQDADDAGDSYDPGNDSVGADTSDFSPAQIAQANDREHNRRPQPGLGGSSGTAREPAQAWGAESAQQRAVVADAAAPSCLLKKRSPVSSREISPALAGE